MTENTKSTKVELRRNDLLFPHESYSILGALFDVYKKLGFGYRENYYQKAIAIGLEAKGFQVEREVPVRISYQGKFISTNYLDFLINKSIVLEIKQGTFFTQRDIDQTYNYLVATNLKLGILARFSKSGVKHKRVLNIS